MKAKSQFSKRLCIASFMCVMVCVTGNFILLWFGREPMSDVTVTMISTFGGFVTCGYFTLCGVRDCSLNKYGKKERS